MKTINTSLDPLDLCTKEGWAAEQERIRAHRARAAADEGPAVDNARFWMASTKQAPPGQAEKRVLFLECERWTDARTVAIALLGGADVDIAALPRAHMKQEPIPRVQVRWVGNAAQRVPDRRMQTRRVAAGGKLGRWEELR